MKKIYSFSLTVLAMAALAVSCNKNAMEEAPAQEPVIRTFTCAFAEPDSKVAIDDSDGKTTWEVNDKIMIHGGTNGAARQLVTLQSGDISADGKTATVSVTIDPYDRTKDGVKSKYYAQYPGDLVPAGNMYYECCFNATNDKLMAACDVDGAFVFYNLCGIISYKVNGDFDQVLFSGNNDETVGYSDYYQVRIREDNSGMVTNYFKPGNGFPTNTPAKSITSAVVADGTTVNTICIPNPSGFNSGFTMNFMKSGSIVKTLSTGKAVTLTRGQYRPMGDITAYLKDYVAPSKHDSGIDMSNAIALDNNGNANCYIIDGSDASNAGQVFTFKAYKGNSTGNVGTIDSAEILWETDNTSDPVTAKTVIAEVDFDKQEENVYYTIVFKMPDTLKPGNAVIVAKNSGGTILWSWHIWIPETSIGIISDSDFYGKGVMDRNLGALDKATTTSAGRKTYGMYYQWGRNNPLPGFAKATADITVVDGPKSTAFSIANPTVFIKVSESDSAGNWNEENLPYLWEDSSKKKEIYDPCPPNYKVPSYSSSTGLWVNANTGWAFNWDANNYSFNDIVFPMAGWYSSGTSVSYEGARSIILSATAYSSAARARLKIIRQDKGGYYFANYFKFEAASVRCVAE